MDRPRGLTFASPSAYQQKAAGNMQGTDEMNQQQQQAHTIPGVYSIRGATLAGAAPVSFVGSSSVSSSVSAPKGMHPVSTIPNYPPSYPNKTLFQVAQALPQPPPRASTAAAATTATTSNSRRIIRKQDPFSSTTELSSSSSSMMTSTTPSATKTPFVFRSSGRAGRVNDWMNEDQKESFVHSWTPPPQTPLEQARAVQRGGLITHAQTPATANIFTDPSQVGIVFTPQPRIGINNGGVGSQLNFGRTEPIPNSATYHPRSLSIGRGGGAGGSFSLPSSSPSPYPAASAAGNRPAEGVFVIRPPPAATTAAHTPPYQPTPPAANTATPTIETPPVAVLPPIPTAAPPQPSPPPPPENSFVNPSPPPPAADKKTTHTLRSGKVGSLSNLFSGGRVVNKSSKNSAAPTPTPSPPPPVSIRTRPVNHIILRESDSSDSTDGAAGDSVGPNGSDDSSVAHVYRLGPKPRLGIGSGPTPEDVALLEAQRAKEALEAETERLEQIRRQAEEAQIQHDTADAKFVRLWREKESACLILLQQFLASPGGRSLLSSKPTHGFLYDHPPTTHTNPPPATATPTGAVSVDPSPPVHPTFAHALKAFQHQNSQILSPLIARKLDRLSATSVVTIADMQHVNLSDSHPAATPTPPSIASKYQQMFHDFNSILTACDGSAVMALWILEKWRLKSGPASASSTTTATGVSSSSSSSSKNRGPNKFTNLSELLSALTRAKQAMVKEQKGWLAYLTHPGLNGTSWSPNDFELHHPHSQPLPPPTPIFPTDATRAKIHLYPHMDALWIAGAGHTAFTLVRELHQTSREEHSNTNHQHVSLSTNESRRSTESAPSDDVPTTSQSSSAQPAPSLNPIHFTTASEFGSFASFLDAIRTRLELSKSAVRRGLSEMSPKFIDGVLWDVLTDPNQTGLPKDEYVYSESSERIVGLKSTPAIRPNPTPLTTPVTTVTPTPSTATPSSNALNESTAPTVEHNGVTDISLEDAAMVHAPVMATNDKDTPASVTQQPGAQPADQNSNDSADDSIADNVASDAPLVSSSDVVPRSPSLTPLSIPSDVSDPSDLVTLLLDVDSISGEVSILILIGLPPSPSARHDGDEEQAESDINNQTTNEPANDEPISQETTKATVPTTTITDMTSPNETAEPAQVQVDPPAGNTEAVPDAGAPSSTSDSTPLSPDPIVPSDPATSAAAAVGSVDSVSVSPSSSDAPAAPHHTATPPPEATSHSHAPTPNTIGSTATATAAQPTAGAAIGSAPANLPPTPDLVDILNLDALSAVLHLSQGVVASLSYLRMICSSWCLNASPPITKLSILLSTLQIRSREFQRQHREGLCTWFERFGHELVRNLNHDYVEHHTNGTNTNTTQTGKETSTNTTLPSGTNNAHTGSAAKSSLSTPLLSQTHDFLTVDQLSHMYWTADCGGKTLRYIIQLFDSKKRFSTLYDLIRRLRKIALQNREDYLIQKDIIRQYLNSEDATLFRTPSHGHSPITFSLNMNEHIDLFLNRCMIPSGTQATPATSTSTTKDTRKPIHSHHRSASVSIALTQPSSSSKDDFQVIPQNWNRSHIDHASGWSIVRHLEYIIRQRRQQTIQEYRVALEASSRELNSHHHHNAEQSDEVYIDKVIQPLLFHDIDSLLTYVATLATKAKSTIEQTYMFIASASSSLLVGRDDSTYSSSFFSNPSNLQDFSRSSASSWTIHDSKVLFEESLAGHEMMEYAQRVSDAKLVHLHRELDTMQHMKLEGRLLPDMLPRHPLSIPCNGEPLEGLKGCSFHFPDIHALSRTINILYTYDVSQEIERHHVLEEQVKQDQVSKSQPKSVQDVLLAWLQREENTLLTPTTGTGSPATTNGTIGGAAAANKNPKRQSGGTMTDPSSPTPTRVDLVKSLTLADMDRLMNESGGGEGTLDVLQVLQKDGKSYPSLNMLIGAVAYELNPEVQPKEGPIVTQSSLMELLRFLSGVETKTGRAKIFSNKIAETKDTILTPTGGGGGSGSGVGTKRNSGGKDFDSNADTNYNPLDLDVRALVATGDPIAPHMYGVSLNEVQVLIGYAFGIENLLVITKDLLERQGQFHSWSDLKSQVITEIKRMNPYRVWMGMPASIVFETNVNATSIAQQSSSTGTGGGVGGTAANGGVVVGSVTHSTTTSGTYENKFVKDVYDFLFNTNHSTLSSMLSSSSSTSKLCRLLPNVLLKIPVQKTDCIVLLRYVACETMIEICGGDVKNTLFILHYLNDPSPRFKMFMNLPQLIEAVRQAKLDTNDELIRGVDALGEGAREIYSYLQSSGSGTGVGTDVGLSHLPGLREKSSQLSSGTKKERLELSASLLASLVEAGGQSSSSSLTNSSAVTSNTPPPALTILSHLTLLGEEYSKGQGEQLIHAVKSQKAAAEAMRRALAENIKQMRLEDEAATNNPSASSSSSSSRSPKAKLLKVVPSKISSTLDQLLVGIEDAMPRLVDIRPFIHTSLPSSLVSIQSLVDRVTSELHVMKEEIQRYQSGGQQQDEDDSEKDVSPQSGTKLYDTIIEFLSTLQELFVSIPGLSKTFNQFFMQLQPLHSSIHTVYSHYYPLYFYLQSYLRPTPHPFFHSLITPSLTDSITFLSQLRIDTDGILQVQQSLTYVLEHLTPCFTEIHAVFEGINKFVKPLPKGERAGDQQQQQDPMIRILPTIQETNQYLISLLPFLSSMFQTNEHYLPFLIDLVPFFESQLRPLLPSILPLLVEVVLEPLEEKSNVHHPNLQSHSLAIGPNSSPPSAATSNHASLEKPLGAMTVTLTRTKSINAKAAINK